MSFIKIQKHKTSNSYLTFRRVATNSGYQVKNKVTVYKSVFWREMQQILLYISFEMTGLTLLLTNRLSYHLTSSSCELPSLRKMLASFLKLQPLPTVQKKRGILFYSQAPTNSTLGKWQCARCPVSN